MATIRLRRWRRGWVTVKLISTGMNELRWDGAMKMSTFTRAVNQWNSIEVGVLESLHWKERIANPCTELFWLTRQKLQTIQINRSITVKIRIIIIFLTIITSNCYWFQWIVVSSGEKKRLLISKNGYYKRF